MSKLFVQVERTEDLIGRADNYFAQPKIEPKPQTNADRIRGMGNDGLAAWYCHDRDCRGCEFGASDGCHLLNWLKAPVEVQE